MGGVVELEDIQYIILRRLDNNNKNKIISYKSITPIEQKFQDINIDILP